MKKSDALLVSFLTLLAVLGFSLYFIEKGKRNEIAPSEITRVPVEVVKEVPVEVIKEVPADISDLDKYAMKIGKGVLIAEVAGSNAMSAAGVEDVSVFVYIDGNIDSVVSEADVRTKLELILRRNGIKITSDSGNLVCVMISGLRDKYSPVYSFNCGVDLRREVYFSSNRAGTKYSHTIAAVVDSGNFGLGGEDVIESMILGSVEKHAESIANAILAGNQDSK